MSFATLLIHTCDIITRTYTRGAAGGQTITETTASSSVACRVRELKPEDVAVLAKDGVKATCKVYFQTDPSVNKRDIIVWGSRRLEVTAWYNPHGMSKFFKVYAYDLKED